MLQDINQPSNHSLSYIFTSLLDELGEQVKNALEDPMICEIMLNSDGSLFIEESISGMQKIGYIDERRASSIIRTIASVEGKQIDVACPIVSCVLPFDGSRFEALLPPLVKAPVFAIRKHLPISLTLEQLVENQMLNLKEYEFVKQALVDGKSILVSGATGCGKTTFINSLINELFIQNSNMRVIILEDTKELCVNFENSISLLASNQEQMSLLLKSSLRLRPDKIIVGEIRGSEALDLIDALSTGHKGGLATIHAGDPNQALVRLSMLISRNKNAPRFIEPCVAGAVDVVIQLKRDEIRHVSEICTVEGFLDNKFILKNI